jgi:hypothetical protein
MRRIIPVVRILDVENIWRNENFRVVGSYLLCVLSRLVRV